MDVSIIIVNYNTKELTKSCIDSVFEYTKGCSFEVILVDNASTDGSESFFKSDSRIAFIPSKENLGFGRGNNLGFEHAKGKYIFFLNSDTYLTGDAVSTLFHFAEDNQPLKIGALGTMLLDAKGRVNKPYAPLPTTNVFRNLFRHLNIGKDSHSVIQSKLRKQGYSEVGFICGADLFVAKNILDQIGAFDPKIFMFCEEIDLCQRIVLSGYQNYVINNSDIVHLGGSSFDNQQKNFSRYKLATQSIIYYWSKYKRGFGLKSALFYRKILACRDMNRMHFSKEQKKEIYDLINKG